MAGFAEHVVEPPFAAPTIAFPFPGLPIAGGPANARHQAGAGRPEFHPILTTDYFEYGTTVNRLDTEGAAVEMADAALGLAASDLTSVTAR